MEENVYNSALQIMLSKPDQQPWGFRITGGADFGTPLTVIKVYGGSIAEQAGLQVDDILVGINEHALVNLSHQDAYQAFVNAGNSFLLRIIRGSQVSSPPNMAMEMAFMENEYVNAYSQELNTSENITAAEVFEQQTVEEQTDNTMLTTRPESGLDAIIAAVLSQGTASQDATEYETFSDIYVNQDTEKQFEDLSYVLSETASNREEHTASTYQMEEVEVVQVKDYKDESYTMNKNLAADQQLEAEATETKTDYQYSEQQLEVETAETKTDYQYSEQQLEVETTETKTDYQYSEQQLEAETTETKTDYQYSEQQLEAETTETKTDYQYSEQQLEAETTETKTDYQFSEQQVEPETKITAEGKPPVENVMADTGVEQQHSDMKLRDNIEKNHPFLPLMVHPKPVLEAGGIKLTLPKDLYDDEFIAETLSGNAEIITGTTLGVNFHKYRRNYDYLKSSSVYQLIHEEESKNK